MKARGKVWFTFLEAKATTNIFCSYKLTSKLCLAYLRLNYNKIGSAVPISKKKKIPENGRNKVFRSKQTKQGTGVVLRWENT